MEHALIAALFRHAAAAACYEEIAASKPKITFHPTSHVTCQGNTVVVEYEDEGTIGVPLQASVGVDFGINSGDGRPADGHIGMFRAPPRQGATSARRT